MGTRFQRVKAWTKDHKDDIIVVSFIGASIAGVIAMTVALVKAENAEIERQTAELNARIDELNAWHEAERLLEERIVS